MLNVVSQAALMGTLRRSQSAHALVDVHQRNPHRAKALIRANEEVVLVRRSHSFAGGGAHRLIPANPRRIF